MKLVLAIGAEGGLLEVYGARTRDQWRFLTSIDCSTLSLFDDDLDPEELHSTSDWIVGWEGLLPRLDRDGVWRLTPIFVHPEIAADIEAILAERALDAHELPRWKRAIDNSRTNPEPPAASVLTIDVSACRCPVRSILVETASLTTFQSLLDVLFETVMHLAVPARTYGHSWILVDCGVQVRLDKEDLVDGRSLRQAGVLSSRLAVVMLGRRR